MSERGVRKIVAVSLGGIALGMTLFSVGMATPAAADEIVVTTPMSDGDSARYVLTSDGSAPRYAVILMPGGTGQLALPAEDGPLKSRGLSDNFLIRARHFFVDPQFVAASTTMTSTPAKILAIVADLERRFGKLKVYVIGTSRSTESTLALTKPLDGQVAGFVHTSSMNAIASLDPRGLKSRHLLVAHEQDACALTRPSNAQASHNNYGTDLIMVDGGKSAGDECKPWAHHGFSGIEKSTINKIKAWITAGR